VRKRKGIAGKRGKGDMEIWEREERLREADGRERDRERRGREESGMGEESEGERGREVGMERGRRRSSDTCKPLQLPQ